MTTTTETEVRTMTTKKGMTVETTLTDREAFDVLRGMTKSDFAQKLLDDLRLRRLLPDQLAWAHKLANEQIARDMGEEPERPQGVQVPGIVKLIQNGLDSGKRGRVTLRTPDGIVQVRYASKGKWEGSIFVTNGVRYGNPGAAMYGFITQGVWNQQRNCPAWVADLVARLDRDPRPIMSVHGAVSMECCFCNRALDDDDSLERGYGPDCKGFYGMDQ